MVEIKLINGDHLKGNIIKQNGVGDGESDLVAFEDHNFLILNHPESGKWIINKKNIAYMYTIKK